MDNTIEDKVLEEVNAEINESIDDAKNKLKEQDIEIEVSDSKPEQPKEEQVQKEETQQKKKSKPQLNDEDLSEAVQNRIKKIVRQKKIEEEKNAKLVDEINSLQTRLEKIEGIELMRNIRSSLITPTYICLLRFNFSFNFILFI